ncbi:MAG TPA: hypothetical protein DIW47_04795 [Bacteroidetes bacterium]|nr:hypothetical protein [Bacteroidota bacterium]
MKSLSPFFWLIILLSACGDGAEYFPKTTFDSPFPKRNRDLTAVLGEKLVIKSGTDTLVLTISSFKNYNLITNSSHGDTLFKGTVCKFRGLYYFSQPFNDTSFFIYAVKLTNNLVYGLNSAWEQTMLIERAIENGQHQKIVRYRSADVIRLYPDKRELKNLFSAIIDSIAPDTLLNFQETAPVLADTSKAVTPIDPDDFEFLSKAYPNPTSDFITIELQQKAKITYQVTNLNGKTVLQGQFTGTKNKIDLSGQPEGIFYLTLIDAANNQKETTTIIKTK